MRIAYVAPLVLPLVVADIGRFILGGINGADIVISPPTASPNPTACGTVVNDEDRVSNASLTYQCLTSVPFDPAVATRFLEYYTDTLQFQSTLAFLKNPPTGYQQPKVDLLDGIKKIQEWVNTPGKFPNQYAFEATVQRLVYLSHDAHLSLSAGVLSAFSFGSPYALATISADGKEIPKVYLWDDLVDSDDKGKKPSAIKEINGMGVVQYLTEFAEIQSVGGLEPHADWNQLMNSPALNILGLFSIFSGSATFYPGDTLTFILENGTVVGPTEWLSIYYSPGDTGPIANGGDFFNFFVLGEYPPSYDPSAGSDTSDAGNTTASASSSTSTDVPDDPVSTPDPTSWDNPAYPIPDVLQPDLATSGGGFVTGYFLNDSSLGVLSIPSFQEFGDAIGTFSDTVGEFLSRSKAAGIKKILIDLQQNTGGDALLAHDTFKRFFPDLEPFAGSRMRAHPAANTLGTTINTYWDGLKTTVPDYFALLANEWVATVRLNAETEKNFSSWAEFFGPHKTNDDSFTRTARFNLSSALFDAASLSGFVPFGYAGNVGKSSTPLYSSKDIVILTDGMCASTCAIFLEMMQNRANVSTIAVGGSPKPGPMQAAAGSRGARLYSTGILDANFDLAGRIDKSVIPLLPQQRNDTGMFVVYAGVNLRDQVRQGSDVPLQFTYDAADCRIYWTFKTYNNYTNLWKYAARAVWTDPSLCVEGSQGHSFVANDTTKAFSTVSSPQASSTSASLKIPTLDIFPGQVPEPILARASRPNVAARSVVPAIGAACTITTTGDTCVRGSVCKVVQVGCSGPAPINQRRCIPTCVPTAGTLPCSGGTKPCTPDKKVRSASGLVFWTGFCAPPRAAKGAPCAAPPGGGGTVESSGTNLAGEGLSRRELGGLDLMDMR